MTTKATEANMSGITVVEFKNSAYSSETYLSSELADGPPYTVHGVALGNNDVTKGKSGIKKKWPSEELEQAANSLQGKNLVIDHENSVHGVIGQVTKAGYKEDTGVVYEAELHDEELAKKIQNNLLEVSVRGLHKEVDDLEKDSESDALIVEDIEFKNLSVVPSGAAPSNTLQMGEHAELSAAELASFTETISESSAELQEIEPGMWVKWDDKHGITISQAMDGEIEVDVYEEKDGEWVSIEETMTLSTDKLSEWDVDEDNVGAAAENKSEEENESSVNIPMPEDAQLLYPTEEMAMEAAKMMGIDGTHEHSFDGESWYMPANNHDEFERAMDELVDDEELELITEGMKFFSTVNESLVKVVSRDGDTILVETMDGESSWKEPVDNVIRKLADGDWEHAGSVEEMMVDPPEWSEGDMVQWQVAPSMTGRIVHNPDDEDIVMVEIMDDGESTGYTVTAGYTDIEPASEVEEMSANPSYSRGDWVRWDTRNSTELGTVTGSYTKGDDLPDFRGSRNLSPNEGEVLYALRMYKQRDGAWHPIEGKVIGHYEDALRAAEKPSDVSESAVELETVTDYEENAVSSKDVPSTDEQPTHESIGSMEYLFTQFMNESGSTDSTLEDFIEWLSDVEELSVQPEGADDILDNSEAIRRFKESDPAYMAFIYQDDDAEELAETFDDYPEAASENAQMALDAKEDTDNPNNCGTDTGWKRAKQLANGESLTREQIGKMSAFNRHRQNSEMEDDEGRSDCGWMMWKAWGGDEGVDWAQQKLEQIEAENGSSEELQEYEMHTPDWSGTTESDWSTPDMEDFDTDDMSEIDDHFLISMDGFPPENYTDLKLPVVEPNGDLNVNALAAVKGGRGVTAVDGLSSDMEEKIVEWVNKTANDPDLFDRNWGEEENSEELEMQFSEGDWVQWSWSGSTAHGKVVETFDGEGTVTRTIEGTEVSKDSDEQPVYMVKVWGGDDFSGKALRQEGARSLKKWDNPPEEEMGMSVPDAHRFSSKEDAMSMAQELELDGVHEMEFDGETMWVPGESHEDYMDAVSENSYGSSDSDDDAEMGMYVPAHSDPTQDTSVGGIRVLPGDDLQHVYNGASAADSLTQHISDIMNKDIEEELGELDEPVAVEAEELEQLQEKASRMEELSDNIDALTERTDILDEVERSAVEELRDGDDPVVVESARFESLQSEAEQVKGVYAAQLSEHYDAFDSDELADKFSIEELREKFESQFGSIEELAGSTQAEPRSQDPSEEELEEGDGSTSSSEEELSETVAEKQQEIRSKLDLVGGN